MSSATPSAELLVSSETVATSAAGRAIKVHYFGRPTARLRILVIGGSLGSEPAVRAALDTWAAWLSDGEAEPRRQETLANARIAVLPTADPEATHRPRALHEIEAGHDQLRLGRVAARRLHRVIATFRPTLILDVRAFAAGNGPRLGDDLELCHDIFFDIPTHPAAIEATQGRADESFLAFAVSQLARQSILASRYMRLGPKGTVRHASPDAAQGRNAWALRFGVPTVLIAGRDRAADSPALPEAREDAERPVRTLVAAIQTTIDWALAERARLTQRLPPLAPGDDVTIASRYAVHRGRARMVFYRPSLGTMDQVELPGRYTPRLVETFKVDAPAAYVVPARLKKVLRLLARHGFRTLDAAALDRTAWKPVAYRITSQGRQQRPRRVELLEWPGPEQGDLLFSPSQPGGRLLCLLLEPHSTHGLCRDASFGLSADEDGAYSILRLEPQQSEIARAA